jgi:hypothetical protein
MATLALPRGRQRLAECRGQPGGIRDVGQHDRRKPYLPSSKGIFRFKIHYAAILKQRTEVSTT